MSSNRNIIIASRAKAPRALARTALGLASVGLAGGALLSLGAQAQTATAPATQGGTGQLPTLSVQDQDAAPAQDYRTERSSNVKLTEKLLDTPQSVTVISGQEMKDQGVTTLRDALRNVAGISLAAGEGGAQGDSLTLRGFSARSDIFLDGLRDFGSYYRDSFNYQSAEVLKGPDSAMFGRGSTGGTINQVSKTPTLEAITAGTATLGTDGMKRLTADVDRAIDATTAVRLNAMGTSSFVEGRDGAKNERYGFAPSVAFGIGTPTRVTISYLHQSENDRPDYGIPFLLGQPAPVDYRTYYGFHSDYLKTDANVVTADVQHDLTSGITLENQFRYGNYYRNVRITEPQLVNANVTPATVGPLSGVAIKRNAITVRSVETTLDDQATASARFNTGFLEHHLVTGVELSRETSDPTRTAWTGVPTTTLLNPNEYQTFAGVGTISSRVSTTVDTVAVFAVDTMKFNEQWSLVGGFRYDHLDTDYKQTVAPAAAFSRTDSLPSGRASLVFKPTPESSLYASFGTSFNPSAEQLSLSAATANLDPESNKTYEVGGKIDLLHDALSVRTALFQTEKDNARVTDPNNSALNVLGGDQKVKGVELEVTGHITEDWQVSTSYAYMDGRVIKSTTFSQVGRGLPNVPHHTFNLWTTYQVTHQLQIGGGANAVSQRIGSSSPVAATNLINTVPGYVTFNAMAKYDITEQISIQANIINLTDRDYVDQIHPAHLVPGEGRTVQFTANFAF
ncbi:TonB-dependent receptor [Nitrospirillum bahiense]|uniref:Catecholate siderophore receptor n=1 Tax=Nitrospirillum amazonense TaxID=28077 RepID=A0A560G3E5_9PROT|nr:TonB-dependent siderophore receptor [Nitrospirillum amazonense]TWB28405.1 catecholate siderophore receptor [Nitrospirillum amazonense]